MGSFEIITEVSLLSSHVALPIEGHLEVAIHVMAHVGQMYNARLMYDPLHPKIGHSIFKKCDWSEFYIDAKEATPKNAPELQGKEVDVHMFVDSNHERDEVSHRSRSGFLMYANTTLVRCFQRNSL